MQPKSDNNCYYEYYTDNDILDIYRVKNYKYKTSLELEEGVILDIDKNNIPVSLEILDASEIFKIKDKNLLSNIHELDMKIEVTEEIIRVDVELSFNSSKKSFSLKSIILNSIKAPVMQTKLVSS
jgi:uncharacterized protein YuzE